MAGGAGRDGGPLLTPREAEVLSLLREGLTNAKIAGRLGITLDGAKYHISQIIGKLGVRNRYEAARWPERSPWWVGALGPLALVWRKARVVAPPKLSALALGASAVVLVVVLAGAGLVAFGPAQGGGETTEGRVVASGDVRAVLQRLGPGTTLHTVELRYRRYGDAEDLYRESENYTPEHSRTEAWMTFDDTGALASMRSETRGLDGVVYQAARSDAGDVVHEGADGAERRRLPGALRNATVGAIKAALSGALAESAAAMDEQPDAPLVTLRSQDAVQLTQMKRPFTRELHPVYEVSEAGAVIRRGYELPYLYDLAPVEEIRRVYISLEDGFSLRSETAVVDAAGRETVVESTDHLVTEVLVP